jgi:V/A-type H+-transporting ATPase subunit F
MSRAAFVGEEKLAYLFRSFDFQIFPVKDSSDAFERIKKIYKDKTADIIITTEDFANEDLGEFIREKTDVMPVIFVLPTPLRNEGLGIEWIRKSVEKAVGINILSKK